MGEVADGGADGRADDVAHGANVRRDLFLGPMSRRRVALLAAGEQKAGQPRAHGVQGQIFDCVAQVPHLAG